MEFIVDEGISENSVTFKCFLKWLGTRPSNFIFLSKAHRGIPDIEIIDKLLPKYQNLLTQDKVLHNRAISKGFKSLILDKNGNLTDRTLAGINLKKSQPPSLRKEIQANYLLKPSAEVCLLTSRLYKYSFFQIGIKRMQAKRRRIRSYFGDIANIASIDFTIASEVAPNGVIG